MVTIIRPGAKKAAPGKKAAPAKKVAPRPRYDDDDVDDDEPVQRRAAKSAANGDDRVVNRVKGGDREADDIFAGGDFAKTFTMKDGQSEVIRFTEDGPYCSFRMHWPERKGRRSFPCIGDKTKDDMHNGCPLCALGIEWRPEARYNIAVLTEEEPLTMSLTAGKRVRKKIIAHGQSNHGPLSRKFYFYTRTGLRFDTEYSFEVARTINDIKDEFPKLYIPSEEEIAELPKFTPDQASKEFVSLTEMRKVAKELMSGDQDDDD